MTIEEGSGNILDRIVERYQEQNIKIALDNEARPSKGDGAFFVFVYLPRLPGSNCGYQTTVMF